MAGHADRMNTILVDRIIGMLLGVITVTVIAFEWGGPSLFTGLSLIFTILLLILLSTAVAWSRIMFVVVGLVLTFGALITKTDGMASVENALRTSAFIAAFFTALTSLRHVADTSAAIQRCGNFLAKQPPGKRYAALTLGGQMFAPLLNYGAISLLGSLATASARNEPNAQIRSLRNRRMLLAIQRGFVSTLPWSPLAFAMAITTSLIPDSSWSGAVLPCLVSGLILAVTGWMMDAWIKPQPVSGSFQREKPGGSWASVLPLLLLLAILVASVAGLHLISGIRAVGVVIVVVPIMAVAWIGIQARGARPAATIAARTMTYFTNDLPLYKGELVLLMMAGFIGTLGSELLVPVLSASGFDLSAAPGWLVLVSIVWIIPLTGQLGMNPILSVSLFAPLFPDPVTLAVSSTDVVVAITAGWALSGASSPYTATTLLIGSFGGVSAAQVGIRWNGLYTIICGILLSGWVAYLAVS